MGGLGSSLSSGSFRSSHNSHPTRDPDTHTLGLSWLWGIGDPGRHLLEGSSRRSGLGIISGIWGQLSGTCTCLWLNTLVQRAGQPGL